MKIPCLQNPWLRILLRWVLSLAILLSVARLDAWYEQDELAKATQVMCLAKETSLLKLHDLPNYYRRDLFSAYYLVATLFYQATGLAAVKALNLLSVLCGATFLAFAPWVINKIIGVSEWLIFAVLWSVPALAVTFCYGNEASLAMASIILAACLARSYSRAGCVAAAVLFGIAVFARSDYVLLFPALALLTVSRTTGAVDVRASLVRVALLAGTALVFGLAYFAIVIRQIPDAEYFEYHTDPKLFCAFIGYGLGLGGCVGAAVGLVRCFVTRQWHLLFAGLVLLQTAPYLTHLTSPKYILPSLVAVAMLAAVGFQWIAGRSRLVCGALLVWPWFVSVTPYGVFAGRPSALWYIPTDAGPIPSGGYLWFYARVKSGFYQARYAQELEQMAKAMPVVNSAPAGADLVGYFQPGTLRVWAAEHQRWDIPPKFVPFVIDDRLPPESLSRRKLLLKTSYLYELKQVSGLREQMAAFYSQARVANLCREDDPFPDVVEVGSLVKAENDRDLGRRISFMNQRSGGEQWVKREIFIPEYGGLAWIPTAQVQRNAATDPAPVYQDDAWTAFSGNVPGGIFYSLRFPVPYARSRPPANFPR